MGGAIGAEELFRQSAGFVASFLHRLGVASRDVPDLVQEVFLLAHQKGGFVPRGTAKPRTWLAAIAVRKAAAYRRKKRELLDEGVVEVAVSQAHDPARRADLREAIGRVQQCLDALDLDHRATFVLYEIEGQSCSQIAEALSVPVGTVYSRLHKARKRFKDEHARMTAAEANEEKGAANG